MESEEDNGGVEALASGAMSSGIVNGRVSFWYAEDGLPVPRAPLDGDTTADVVIVGGGYTGLWTAYYLKKAAPFSSDRRSGEGVLWVRGFRAQRGLVVQRGRGEGPVRARARS